MNDRSSICQVAVKSVARSSAGMHVRRMTPACDADKSAQRSKPEFCATLGRPRLSVDHHRALNVFFGVWCRPAGARMRASASNRSACPRRRGADACHAVLVNRSHPSNSCSTGGCPPSLSRRGGSAALAPGARVAASRDRSRDARARLDARVAWAASAPSGFRPPAVRSLRHEGGQETPGTRVVGISKIAFSVS